MGNPFCLVLTCSFSLHMKGTSLLSVRVLLTKQFLARPLELGEAVALYNLQVTLLCVFFFFLW